LSRCCSFRSDAQITALFCGDPVKPHLLLLGICGTTAFISMWIHNTPCTVMMMPVATGILQRLPRGELEGGSSSDARVVQRFSKAVVLGVVYASAVGGMATLTGTGVNIILVGMWSTYFPEQDPITFSSWMAFGLPMALILFVALWATLCLMYCSKNTGSALSAYLDRSHLRRELSLLGRFFTGCWPALLDSQEQCLACSLTVRLINVQCAAFPVKDGIF